MDSPVSTTTRAPHIELRGLSLKKTQREQIWKELWEEWREYDQNALNGILKINGHMQKRGRMIIRARGGR